jgi:hypothetical protein
MNRLSELGQVVITVGVFGLFTVDSGLVFTHVLPDGAHDIAKDTMSGLLVLLTSVVNWWIQSNRGSAIKDDTIRVATQALAVSTPPPAAQP